MGKGYDEAQVNDGMPSIALNVSRHCCPTSIQNATPRYDRYTLPTQHAFPLQIAGLEINLVLEALNTLVNWVREGEKTTYCVAMVIAEPQVVRRWEFLVISRQVRVKVRFSTRLCKYNTKKNLQHWVCSWCLNFIVVLWLSMSSFVTSFEAQVATCATAGITLSNQSVELAVLTEHT